MWNKWQPDDMNKVNTGCSPFLGMRSRLTQFPGVVGYEDSSSPATHRDMSIGKSSFALKEKEDYDGLKTRSGQQFTPSCPEVKRQKSMFSKKTPESPTPNSNLEVNRSEEIPKKIGKRSGRWPSPVIMKKLIRSYDLCIIGLSELSTQTIRDQLEWSELVSYTGVELVLESRGELGKRQEWMLTLRIQTLNFGAVTKARRMLSLMSFVEISRSQTCYDGLIDIHVTLKSKDQVFPWQRRNFG